jgi:HlyD family secretion protein
VVRAGVAGRVREISVVEGARVEPGQVLAELESADVRAGYRLASADLERMLRLAAEARSDGDVVTAAERQDQAAEAGARRRMLGDRVARLELRAPIGGIVTTPDLETARGRFLDVGDELCTVDRLDTVRLAVAVSEVDAQQIEVGTPLRILAAAYPARTLRAEVRHIAPLAIPPSVDEEARLDLVQRVHVVRVGVEIDNAGAWLRPGMSGRVQFLTRSRSVAGKAWWGLRRWFSSIVW